MAKKIGIPTHPTLPLGTRVIMLPMFENASELDWIEATVKKHADGGYVLELLEVSHLPHLIQVKKGDVREKPVFIIKDDEIPVCLIIAGRIICMEMFTVRSDPYYDLEIETWAIQVYTSCEITKVYWNTQFKHWYIEIL